MLKCSLPKKSHFRKISHLRKKEQVSNPPLRADVSDFCGCFLRLLLMKSCSCVAEKLVSSRDSEVCGGRATSNPAVSALQPCSSTTSYEYSSTRGGNEKPCVFPCSKVAHETRDGDPLLPIDTTRMASVRPPTMKKYIECFDRHEYINFLLSQTPTVTRTDQTCPRSPRSERLLERFRCAPSTASKRSCAATHQSVLGYWGNTTRGAAGNKGR